MYNEMMINQNTDTDQFEQFLDGSNCEPLPANFVASRGLFAKQDEIKQAKRQKWTKRIISVFYLSPTSARLAAE
jgi:hypothetical protein